MNTQFDKKNTIWILILQSVILISTAVTAGTGIVYGASSSQDGDHMIGLGYFKAFTMDSNILVGICALFLVCFAIRNLLKKEEATPKWAVLFQQVTASCLFLTFVIVVFFLAPTDVLSGKSYWGMFSDDLFFFHLVNPILSIVCFVFLQKKYRLKSKDAWWSLVPLGIYAAFYFLMVIVFQKWDDFYGFSFGGRNFLIPAVVLVLFLLMYLLARLLIRMNGRVLERKNTD